MTRKSRRKNLRQRDFAVVARAVHRTKPDYSRLMQATLDHFVAQQTGGPLDSIWRSSGQEKPQ